MASSRLRLNRSGSQPQLPPAKCARIAEQQALLLPLETTSHWILNDRLVGQLQHQAVGSAAILHRSTCAYEKTAETIDLTSSKRTDVIVVNSSQEDTCASDYSSIDQSECTIDNLSPSFFARNDISHARVGQRVIATVPVLSDDDGLIGNDEQFYNFGEEEEFLSQAAVERWQKGPEARLDIDDSQLGMRCPPALPCTSSPSPAQQLLAFLMLHNLDTLQPTLMAHEVASLDCMCMLTHNDIAYAGPAHPPVASCCLCAPFVRDS
jgi:hypothetical protein